jgi:hypothetical protein
MFADVNKCSTHFMGTTTQNTNYYPILTIVNEIFQSFAVYKLDLKRNE